jgi:hypothetical protein
VVAGAAGGTPPLGLWIWYPINPPSSPNRGSTIRLPIERALVRRHLHLVDGLRRHLIQDARRVIHLHQHVNHRLARNVPDHQIDQAGQEQPDNRTEEARQHSELEPVGALQRNRRRQVLAVEEDRHVAPEQDSRTAEAVDKIQEGNGPDNPDDDAAVQGWKQLTGFFRHH